MAATSFLLIGNICEYAQTKPTKSRMVGLFTLKAE